MTRRRPLDHAADRSIQQEERRLIPWMLGPPVSQSPGGCREVLRFKFSEGLLINVLGFGPVRLPGRHQFVQSHWLGDVHDLDLAQPACDKGVAQSGLGRSSYEQATF